MKRPNISLVLVICMTAICITVASINTFYRAQLEGNGSLGYYFMTLYVGQPPQKQQFFIDTGSSVTTLTCSVCQACEDNFGLKIFDSQRSFTNKKALCKNRLAVCKDRCERNKDYCEILNSYGDGSINIGTIVEDQFSFESNQQDHFKAYFSCKKYSKDQYILQTNGLLGLSPSPVDNIFYYWFNQPGRESQFSICLGKDKGYIQIGKSPETSSNYQISLDYNPTSYFYSIYIENVRYGQKNILNQPLSCVIDTGSTISYLPFQVVMKLYTSSALVCQGLSNCRLTADGCFIFEIANVDDEKAYYLLNTNFPPIRFKIGGQNFDWMPENYFLMSEIIGLNNRAICFAIHQSKKLHVLGANWMRGRKFTFDLNHQKIIVLNNQQCKYVPFENQNKDDFNTKIKITLEKIGKFMDQYWMVVGLVILSLVFLIKSKFELLMNTMKRVCCKKRAHMNEQQPQVQDSVSQSSSISTSIKQQK